MDDVVLVEVAEGAGHLHGDADNAVKVGLSGLGVGLEAAFS